MKQTGNITFPAFSVLILVIKSNTKKIETSKICVHQLRILWTGKICVHQENKALVINKEKSTVN